MTEIKDLTYELGHIETKNHVRGKICQNMKCKTYKKNYVTIINGGN